MMEEKHHNFPAPVHVYKKPMPGENKRITTDEEVNIDYALYVVQNIRHADKKKIDAKRKRQRNARKIQRNR